MQPRAHQHVGSFIRHATQKVALLCLVLPMIVVAKGQDTTRTDSLAAVVRATPSTAGLRDTLRIDALLDSAKAWVSNGETERPVIMAQGALRLLKAIRAEIPATDRLERRVMQAAKLEGIAHHYAGRHAPALKCFQAMESAAGRCSDVKNSAAAMNYQAYQYRAMNELERAKGKTLQALAILARLPEDGNLANTHSGLGSIYTNLDVLDSAFLHQRTALGIYHRAGLTELEALCRLDLADLFMLRGRHATTASFLKAGAYDSALHYLELARPALENSPNTADRCIFLDQLARAYYGSGRYDDAHLALTQAHALAMDSPNDEHQYRTMELLALVASAQHDPPEALRWQALAREATIRDQDLAKAQEMTQVRLEAEHEKASLLAQQRLDEQRSQKRTAVIGGALALLIAALLLWLLTATRRAAAALRKKNDELVRTQDRLVLAEKQREAEQVRTRIASDIHDELGGDLTKITLLGNEVKRRSMEDPSSVPEVVDRLGRLSREVAGALRDIVWSVDPEQDTWQGLVSHASAYAQRVLHDTGIQADLHFAHNGPDAPIDTALKRDIFLVLKEALNNALKHAKATTISVQFTSNEEGFLLVVKDNGTGFDATRSGRDGNGLRNMHARSARLGAVLTLDPVPGRGTTLTVDGRLVHA